MSNSEVIITEQVTEAFKTKSAINIVGGNSKFFYGNAVEGETLLTSEHKGIIEYTPSELVITAKAGTPLKEITQELACKNQKLAFEPPQHSEHATLGGAIASGMSGPGRAFAGSARDFVLGTKIINGKGEILRFGGQVMKNVAGYDASRLMTGAQGTLGVLLELSLKVLPIPEHETTLKFEFDFDTAQKQLHQWLTKGTPVTASCFYNNALYIRLSSTLNSVNRYKTILLGEEIEPAIWQQLQHQTHNFFKKGTIWRVSVPVATEQFDPDSEQLIEWGGALRWIATSKDMFTVARQHGGHATRYDLSGKSSNIFQPLDNTMLALQQRIKNSFDPVGILNPGRIYAEL